MSQPILYFMRHGETDWNVERRLQGQHDTPLNARGRGQALAGGEILRGLLARDGLTWIAGLHPLNLNAPGLDK